MEENSSQSNKYDAALAKYNTNLSDADIQARVADLIEKKVPENNTEEVKKLLFNCIDLTTLNSTDSDESVMHFTEKVNEFDNEFPDMKNVAAICVYPNFADIVKNTLQVDGINIHDAGQFSDFFGQYSHIGQFAEVADAVCLYPFVYLFLSFFQSHNCC